MKQQSEHEVTLKLVRSCVVVNTLAQIFNSLEMQLEFLKSNLRVMSNGVASITSIANCRS